MSETRANTGTTEGSAKPPADRSGCKAWCGMTPRAIDDAGLEWRNWRWFQGDDEKGSTWFCTLACRDARLPPIAAPAHVERRKGQRWRHVCNGYETEWILTERRGDRWDCFSAKNVVTSGVLLEVCWDKGMMTLIADAPADPGGAGEAVECGGCEAFEETGEHSPLCPTVLRAPPAQEAPKAAPVCGNARCKTPSQNVAQRWSPRLNDAYERVGADLEWSCEPCHLLDEKEFAGLMTFESTGTPYKGPERVLRPALAVDWIWDTLPDGGR